MTIEEIKAGVEKVAKEYDLKKVTLFGSYAEGKQTAKSDVDLLVEFIDDSKATYFTVYRLQAKLEKSIGKKVDALPAPIPRDSLLRINKEVFLYGA